LLTARQEASTTELVARPPIDDRATFSIAIIYISGSFRIPRTPSACGFDTNRRGANYGIH
jgi:hypothetical protein